MKFFGILYAGSDANSKKVLRYCQLLQERGWLEFELRNVDTDTSSRREMSEKFGVSGPPVLRMPSIGTFLDDLTLHSYFDHKIEPVTP